MLWQNNKVIVFVQISAKQQAVSLTYGGKNL